MEGTAGAVIGARFLQLQMALDDVDDIDAIEQIAFEGIRNHARLGAVIGDLSKLSPASAPREHLFFIGHFGRNASEKRCPRSPASGRDLPFRRCGRPPGPIGPQIVGGPRSGRSMREFGTSRGEGAAPTRCRTDTGSPNCRRPVPGRLDYAPSLAFTREDTLAMSARPASLGLSTAMTLPMSCIPLAPAAATAAATSPAISASESCCGM